METTILYTIVYKYIDLEVRTFQTYDKVKYKDTLAQMKESPCHEILEAKEDAE